MTDDAEPQLPPGIALAWGLTPRAGRGPKPTLTLERIVAAGMEIAVADGIAAVSMARVAERVGVSTMGLYRYVAAKDDLLEVMVDTALGPPPARGTDETWRDGLERWARGVRAAYRAHPWVLRVPVTAPPLGPNNIRWLEDALTSLRGTPLTMQQKVSCVLLLNGFIRNSEQLRVDTETSMSGPSAYGAQLALLVDGRDLPEVRALADSGAADEEDDGADFEFGIARILDGIGALVPDAGTGSGSRRRD